MTDESDFKKYRPSITEVTIVEAANAYGIGDEILSLNVKRAGLNSLVLVLATDSETRGPFLLNATCARELCALLLSEGHGPRET